MGKLTPLAAPPKPCKCGICAYRATLDSDDVALFTSWLEDETISSATITRHLANQDPPVHLSGDGILRWRRREAACRRG